MIGASWMEFPRFGGSHLTTRPGAKGVQVNVSEAKLAEMIASAVAAALTSTTATATTATAPAPKVDDRREAQSVLNRAAAARIRAAGGDFASAWEAWKLERKSLPEFRPAAPAKAKGAKAKAKAKGAKAKAKVEWVSVPVADLNRLGIKDAAGRKFTGEAVEMHPDSPALARWRKMTAQTAPVAVEAV